ncbi:MAG: class I SAM-dependent methyltransferase [Lachnospiraceae bacterium]|nr:class I SAM-dependent methyltransferase [Lachnospiraceae bacterium]
MRDVDDYVKTYLETGDFEHILVRYRRRKVLEMIHKYMPASLMEIGCGMEPLGCYYQPPKHYILFEPGEAFFENAMERLKDLRCELDAFPEPFRPVPELHADMIICAGLLHELEDPWGMLQDIYDTAGEETIIHVNVPNAFSMHRVLARHMGLLKDQHELSDRNTLLQQHTVFDMDSLQSMCRFMGFNVLESGSYFLKPFTHDQMHKMIAEGVIGEAVLDGLYHMGEEAYGCEIYVNLKKKPKQ